MQPPLTSHIHFHTCQQTHAAVLHQTQDIRHSWKGKDGREMDIQDGLGNHEQAYGTDAMSPAGSVSNNKSTKLQLPLSCDPPGPTNPAKQLVWIVSSIFFSHIHSR